MNLAEKQYWAGEFTDAELDAAADAGDRYLVQAPIENELFGLWFRCSYRIQKRM